MTIKSLCGWPPFRAFGNVGFHDKVVSDPWRVVPRLQPPFVAHETELNGGAPLLVIFEGQVPRSGRHRRSNQVCETGTQEDGRNFHPTRFLLLSFSRTPSIVQGPEPPNTMPPTGEGRKHRTRAPAALRLVVEVG